MKKINKIGKGEGENAQGQRQVKFKVEESRIERKNNEKKVLKFLALGSSLCSVIKRRG